MSHGRVHLMNVTWSCASNECLISTLFGFHQVIWVTITEWHSYSNTVYSGQFSLLIMQPTTFLREGLWKGNSMHDCRPYSSLQNQTIGIQLKQIKNLESKDMFYALGLYDGWHEIVNQYMTKPIGKFEAPDMCHSYAKEIDSQYEKIHNGM